MSAKQQNSKFSCIIFSQKVQQVTCEGELYKSFFHSNNMLDSIKSSAKRCGGNMSG